MLLLAINYSFTDCQRDGTSVWQTRISLLAEIRQTREKFRDKTSTIPGKHGAWTSVCFCYGRAASQDNPNIRV